MMVEVGCRFMFDVPSPTHAVLLIEPHTSEVDRINGSLLELTPEAPAIRAVDGFGNRCQRLTLPGGLVQIDYRSLVETSGVVDPADQAAGQLEPHEVANDELPFLLPSRYCESDQMSELAWSTFGACRPGWERVQAVMDWVHERIEFDYGRSSPAHTAASVLDDRAGVCRDFTHVAIALCRALNVPARYVFGYLPDIGVPASETPMDFCAWMEVRLDSGWWTFDPRNNQRRAGRVVIGRGRDAADVAMVTSFGALQLVEMTVIAREAPVHSGVTST